MTGDPARVGGRRPARARARRIVLLAACGVLLALGLDWSRPGPEQVSARLLLAAIDGYQAALSPAMGAAGVRCRFRPTCSRYAEAVIRRDGALVGTARAAWRIARCGPWTPQGTADPP